jgi:hypothetical protein
MKYKPKRSEITIRELPPKVESTPKGVLVKCPFCNPPHLILPGVVSPCGTTLKVTAVQEVFKAHVTRHQDIHCLKCGQTGKEMVRYRAGFVCLEECSPGTKLMTELPPLRKSAKVIFGLPPKIRHLVEKYTGPVQELQEINAEGKQTGQVVGYFFWKGK